VQLEREFGVVITAADVEVENFRSIARIADFVAACAGSRAD
jgi:acyl carrier protein